MAGAVTSQVGTDTDLRLVHPPPEPPRRAVPSEVLGTMIFILTEIMLFGGFISAFLVARSSAAAWPPPDQPRLPIEETAFNTVALISSGLLLYYAGKRFEQSPASAKLPMALSVALGLFFVVFQGVEWASLLGDGLTLTSTTYGGFFYLLVGAHALHAIGGLFVLMILMLRLQRGQLKSDGFWAGRLFWYFVVLLWPILYWQVYLS